MTDVYDERAAAAEYARPEAQEAAARIARGAALDGTEDPAYIAHTIEVTLKQFEKDPDAVILERLGSALDPRTGMSWNELLEETRFDPPAGTQPLVAKAARAAAIRIARAYEDRIRPTHEFLEWAPYTIAEAISQPTSHARMAEVEASLREIQAHRRVLGMTPLDTHAAGWTEQDVFDEARRIAALANPLEDLKHRLI